MKTHLLPKAISALLLVGMISLGQPVLAAPQQQMTAQNGSFQLTQDQISQLNKDPKYAKTILANNPGVSPAAVATAIAEALNSNLSSVAPKIAAAMVEYIITPGVTPARQQQAADVVSVFVSFVKGSSQERTAAITAIAKEVSQVVRNVGGSNGTELAKNIVGTTVTNLKFSAEGADKGTLDAFAQPFKTGNETTDSELTKIVTQVNNGQAYNALPPSPTILNNNNNNNINNGAINTGNVVPPESNPFNVLPPA